MANPDILNRLSGSGPVPEDVKDEIIAEYMKTPEGRSKLVQSTLEPARVMIESWNLGTRPASSQWLQTLEKMLATMDHAYSMGAPLGLDADTFLHRRFEIRRIGAEMSAQLHPSPVSPTAWVRLLKDDLV